MISGFPKTTGIKVSEPLKVMSLVTLIVVSCGRMSISELHYRHVIEILASSFSCIEALVSQAPHPAVLDAGYILIDMDSKIIVSRQNAFSLHHLPKRLKAHIQKEWLVA